MFVARATIFCCVDVVRGFVVRADVVAVRGVVCFDDVFLAGETVALVRVDVFVVVVRVAARFVLSVVDVVVVFPRIIGVFSLRTAASAPDMQTIIDTIKVRILFISGVNLSKIMRCRASKITHNNDKKLYFLL